MRIAVVNGSPKSASSITLQYVRYIQRERPGVDFDFVDVARRLRTIERSAEQREALLDRLAAADALLWSFPVYYLLVPWQLKRFIELLFESSAGDVLRGKLASCLTTSIHFFDHTAHDYICAVSEDLGMRALPGFSARMDNLFQAGVRSSLLGFFDELVELAGSDTALPRRFPPLRPVEHRYNPPIGRSAPEGEGRAVLVTDNASANLRAMQAVFEAALPMQVERIELDRLEIKGGCLGCLRCAEQGRCVYRDDMQQAWQLLLSADAIVMAGSVRDRYLSGRWKLFFDRSFFQGHRPLLSGKQAFWLVAGPLRQMDTLRQVLEGHAQVSRANLVDLVCDEDAEGEALTRLLTDSAGRLAHAVGSRARRPRNFLGVAGTRIFRDFVFLTSSLFQEDHRFYLQHGIYDFSQKEWAARARNALMGLAMRLPPLRRRIQRDMRSLMVWPYRRLVDRPGVRGPHVGG
ncbi:MAG: NAD(P)H-dependent oxidoreductase [Deltaproteobacteria bacterium]|nr:NAD(P)H-dependent oxidoreductase [Deltaproteobacteria bacterium]